MPPDLPEATRLSSVVSNVCDRSAEGNDQSSARQENGTQHSSIQTTSIHAETGSSQPPSTACSVNKLYYITPQLRDTFASVGATHKPYQFKEVMIICAFFWLDA